MQGWASKLYAMCVQLTSRARCALEELMETGGKQAEAGGGLSLVVYKGLFW